MLFYAKHDYLLFNQMLELSLGVACDATFFVFYAKHEFVMLSLLLGCPQGQKVDASWSETMQIVKKSNECTMGGTSKTISKCY